MSMRRLIPFLICLALSACAQGNPSDDVRLVGGDPGGDIFAYHAEVLRLNRTGTPVRFVGDVASSATMLLGANDVCVNPEVKFGFHSSFPLTNAQFVPILFVPAEFEKERKRYNAAMAFHYTPALRKWFYKNAANTHLITVNLTGQQLHTRFGYKLCGDKE